MLGCVLTFLSCLRKKKPKLTCYCCVVNAKENKKYFDIVPV